MVLQMGKGEANVKTAVINARIIDGTGAPVRRGSLVLDDNRIISVVPQEASLPDVGHTMDVKGATVLPGLIDAHEHQTYHNTFGPLPMQWRLPRDQLIVRSCVAACDALRHGVTSIREMGAPGATNLAMKRIVDRGEMVGPRMITCGSPLAITGGHAYEICVEVNGTDSVRAAVRQQLKNGADFIKLMASEEQPRPGEEEQTVPQFTSDEIQAAVDEGHDAGVKVTAHVCGTEAIKRCLDAGVDSINHGIYLNRDLAEQMKEQGIAYTPTLGVYQANTESRWQRGGAKAAFCRLLLQAHRHSFEQALEVGLSLTIGTDAIVPIDREMQHLIDAGLSPMEAICAATQTNAHLIGLGDTVGSLEAGKLADILVVDGDPLAQISDLRKVKIIWQNGELLHPDQLLPMLPLTEPPPPEDNLR